MFKKRLKVYLLYEIRPNGEFKFIERFGSLHRLHNAVRGLGLTKYVIEDEAKDCEYGGYISLRGIK
jgi:hypothetical protein